MSTSNYYSNLITQTARRSVEATISILGITDKGLRKHLYNELGGNKENFGLLAEPVFESMFPWEASDHVMSSLASNLLQPSLIQAMDSSGDHKFGKEWYPFKHQYKAWTTLINEPQKSLVVTSGTGSGKTECFMVPILNDLAQEYEADLNPLVGVRALFIYPLNALINSQRERLRAWTQTYEDGLRFCLFNGNTEENKHKDQSKNPNEVLTRKVMRSSPAPMLVTNATMLEYMLVRQIDEPIIQKSQGKLRWIVLDEAHTYIGSQAAELSLLLRRVMHAFGVEAKNVRFVATSATIGDEGSDKQLQKYLADLSGVSLEQVVVIGGKRSIPRLPDFPMNTKSLIELSSIDRESRNSKDRFNALASNITSVKLRTALTASSTPSTLSNLTKYLFDDDSRHHETLQWIDVCSSTSMPGKNPKHPEVGSQAYLPVRGHLFHQVMSGLWCCADKNCTAKHNTELSDSWAFGRVYSQRRNHCGCGAPIFELAFCNECNTPHLLAIEKNNSLVQIDREAVDEFSLDSEDSEESDSGDEIPEFSDKVIIAPKQHTELTYSRSIDNDREFSPTSPDTLDLNIITSEDVKCVSCEFSGYKSPFYRRSLLGTPFYITNTVPTLLDACQESEGANELPSRGKRLITFTDSRQGTARISTKIQQDSERDSIRGLVYGTAAHNVATMNDSEHSQKLDTIKEYNVKIKLLNDQGLESISKDIEKLASALMEELEGIGKVRSINWNDAVSSLQASPDISRWIFDYYQDLNPQLFPESGGVRVLTEMLLLREFARRPKRQNSMETLGLVSVQYPVLDQIEKTPTDWEGLGLTLSDWRDFLKVTLDFYVRENSIIDIPPEWVAWMGAKIYPKTVLKPGTDEATSSRIRRWPQIVPGRNNRLIRMLCVVCKLDPSEPFDKDRINGLLNSAWQALTALYQIKNERSGEIEIHRILKPKSGSVEFHLARDEMAFQVCTQAWICPYTHRLIDTTFKGITPYLPFNANESDIHCRRVDLSICNLDVSHFSSDLERKTAVREWASHQSTITALREENLWTDISDKVIEGGKFYRAAEHSAQQPASKLAKYEALFKKGKLNVLSCSTTMEMGVDIGGISVVAMNNVPPHPANYLQRAGRAGRRGETQALAFTICKDNPHERGVFINPLWPFVTSIDAPYITLSSNRIVQRHINSLLLSSFLKDVIDVQSSNILSLSCEWFFSNESSDISPVERMLRWLESFKFEGIPKKLYLGIKQIIKGSILAGASKDLIIDKSMDALIKAKDSWLPGYNKIKFELSKISNVSDKDPFKRKLTYDLKCIGEGYLLSELASRAFLPGYGFPTGVVNFDHYSVDDYKRGKYVNKRSGRIDNQTRLRERPGRDMAVAIREYAPGADIVLDGLVYRSAGIILNNYSPNEDYSTPQQMTKEWRCHSCGSIGNESASTFDGICSDCGATLRDDNIKEYIKPTGFAVEFYSSPSTDISTQMYIPVQEPWVTADAPIQSLFEPRLGTYRNNSQGHIFNHSSGEHNTGFAVCLRCGKAESMTENGEYPDNVQPRKPHKRLQGKPDSESSIYCEGPDDVYAIKEGVHLGATDQTDVFELYLKYPNENRYIKHETNDALHWTLAVVLRQALADIHGINAEEMGYTVKESTLPDCKYPVAGVVLFDKSGGGAGFSSAAPIHIKDMLTDALKHLDCADNCDSACQTCLMGYDTRFHIDLLNRHVAIDYINKILPYLDVVPEAQILGTDTKYCLEPVSAEILAGASSGGKKLRIISTGDYSQWDINSSNLKESCLNWRNSFESIELVLPSSDISMLSEVHREDLIALSNFGVKLLLIDSEKNSSLENGTVLCQVISDKEILSFATDYSEATVPCSEWWNLDDYYLVKSDTFVAILTSEFNKDDLVLSKQQGDVEVELTSECDGTLADFGENFWAALQDKSASLKSSLNGTSVLNKLTYSDCYISSPWSMILFSEIVDSLKLTLGDRWAKPGLYLSTGEKKVNPNIKGLYADWRNNLDQINVIQEYFKELDESISIDIKPIKELPHGRLLTLEWNDGSKLFIRLDHGVGCWSMDKQPGKWFDVEWEAESQVQYIFDVFKYIKIRYNKKFPTQIFIKKR